MVHVDVDDGNTVTYKIAGILLSVVELSSFVCATGEEQALSKVTIKNTEISFFIKYLLVLFHKKYLKIFCLGCL